jgi:hypothetical protein
MEGTLGEKIKKVGAKASTFILLVKLENLLQQFFQIVLTPQIVNNQTNPTGNQQQNSH